MPETRPQYSPASGIGSVSPKKEWKFAQGGWVKNVAVVPKKPALKPAATPTPTPSSFKQETPATVLPALPAPTQKTGDNQLGNLTVALRTALTEASQATARSRMEALSGFVSGGAAPSVINAAIGLAQGGLRQRQEVIFKETVGAYQEEQRMADERRKSAFSMINTMID